MQDNEESDTLDPTIIVAAASVHIGHKASSRDRLDLDTDLSCNPVYGVAEGGDRDTNIRTFCVIDSLASLCVSQPRAQVVSIALQLDFKRGKMSIILAENSHVSDATAQYVTKLWAKLTDLSNEYEQRRAAGPTPSPGDSYLSKSPDVPTALPGADLHHIICDLMELIYEFTQAKFNKRINKWWGPLRTFIRAFVEVNGKRLQGLEGEFEKMMVAFIKGLAALQAGQKDWSEIELWMNDAAVRAQKILDDNIHCERWAIKIAGSEQEPFALRRAIEKLTSHHRYIRQLIRFAHSPRLHRVFSLVMVVDRVPAAPSLGAIALPGSAEGWQSFLRRVFFGEGIRGISQEWMREESEKLYQWYQHKDFVHRPHSECSLVAFLETAQGDGRSYRDPPPFSYIGLSKLSCKPCSLWFKVFNAQGGRQYYTRGTHGKWYFPWTMPAMPHWLGTPALANEMKSAYIHRMKIYGIFRSSSDSTDASGSIIFEEIEEVEEKKRAVFDSEIDSIVW